MTYYLCMKLTITHNTRTLHNKYAITIIGDLLFAIAAKVTGNKSEWSKKTNKSTSTIDSKYELARAQ